MICPTFSGVMIILIHLKLSRFFPPSVISFQIFDWTFFSLYVFATSLGISSDTLSWAYLHCNLSIYLPIYLSIIYLKRLSACLHKCRSLCICYLIHGKQTLLILDIYSLNLVWIRQIICQVYTSTVFCISLTSAITCRFFFGRYLIY